MAEKFKEQAVIISQEEIARKQTAPASNQYLRKLTKRTVPHNRYIGLQAKETKNFPRSRPESISL